MEATISEVGGHWLEARLGRTWSPQLARQIAVLRSFLGPGSRFLLHVGELHIVPL
jgi:hypothetical protein